MESAPDQAATSHSQLHCAVCDYLLTGVVVDNGMVTCPECGKKERIESVRLTREPKKLTRLQMLAPLLIVPVFAAGGLLIARGFPRYGLAVIACGVLCAWMMMYKYALRLGPQTRGTATILKSVYMGTLVAAVWCLIAGILAFIVVIVVQAFL